MTPPNEIVRLRDAIVQISNVPDTNDVILTALQVAISKFVDETVATTIDNIALAVGDDPVAKKLCADAVAEDRAGRDSAQALYDLSYQKGRQDAFAAAVAICELRAEMKDICDCCGYSSAARHDADEIICKQQEKVWVNGRLS